ncbi:MAG: nitrilase-related carbon-nitrogen hydrolase, partial [Candidatus Nanopelagicales bacterium]
MAKIALAQINPTVGALASNSELIIKYCQAAHEQGAELVIFGEMALTGYPIEDLALRPSFQQASKKALIDIARKLSKMHLGHIQVIVGFLDSSP